MQSRRLQSVFAMLLLTLAAGTPAAQAQAPRAPRAEQGPTSEEIERLRRELELARQQPGQPLLVVPSTAAAAAPAPRPELPTVELAPLLERVERASDKRFLVDGRLGARIYLAGVEPNDVTYPVLLSILRANGFAAFESEGFVNIVPDANIRFHGPVVQTDDPSIPSEVYITRVLAPVNIEATQLVPILRPLLPQAAHLAAHASSNQLVIMDRYENVKRITEIVRLLDVPPRD